MFFSSPGFIVIVCLSVFSYSSQIFCCFILTQLNGVLAYGVVCCVYVRACVCVAVFWDELARTIRRLNVEAAAEGD